MNKMTMLFLCLVLCSCANKKDSGTTSGGGLATPTTGSLSMTANNNNLTGIITTCQYYTQSNQQYLHVQGSDNQNYTLDFVVTRPVSNSGYQGNGSLGTPLTFTFYTNYGTSNQTTYASSVSGSSANLTLISFDIAPNGRAVGSFIGTLNQSGGNGAVNIANGSFSCTHG